MTDVSSSNLLPTGPALTLDSPDLRGISRGKQVISPAGLRKLCKLADSPVPLVTRRAARYVGAGASLAETSHV